MTKRADQIELGAFHRGYRAHHRTARRATRHSEGLLVSCAGLPRAILGAQTLIDAGVPSFVAYPDDGIKGWTNAGLTLETGRTAAYGEASDEAKQFAAEHIVTLSKDDGLTFIDRATAESWAGQRRHSAVARL